MNLNVENFWSRVDSSGGADACWPWTASRDPAGYGRVSVKDPAKGWRPTPCSRVAFALTNPAAVIEGMHVCHRCDNPPCCNPAHLFLGTPSDNTNDMHEKGRNRQPKGSAKWHAKLNEEQVAELRRRYVAGETTARLAAEFGMSQGAIGAAIRGELWKHMGPGVPLRWARAKLSHIQIIEIRGSTDDVASLADRYGVERRIIRDIVAGRTFRNIQAVP